MHQQFDVLSIGDIVTDAFIKLIESEARVIEDEHGKWHSEVASGQDRPETDVEDSR